MEGVVSGTPQPIIGYRRILDDPHGVAAELVAGGAIYGLVAVEVRRADDRKVVMRLTLDPWKAMAAKGYPTEQVDVTVGPDRQIKAVPVGNDTRTWEHRNRSAAAGATGYAELCLWDPRDTRRLRWLWSDGLAAYITIVHRHLLAEEFHRQNGDWPVEDAPHGAGNHPIRTEGMRRAAYPEAP